MANLSGMFLNYLEGKGCEDAEVQQALSTVERYFLSNYPVCIANDYYEILEDKKEILPSKLHDTLIEFWDVFKEFDCKAYSGFTVVECCKRIVRLDSLIKGGTDFENLMIELINNFNGALLSSAKDKKIRS